MNQEDYSLIRQLVLLVLDVVMGSNHKFIKVHLKILQVWRGHKVEEKLLTCSLDGLNVCPTREELARMSGPPLGEGRGSWRGMRPTENSRQIRQGAVQWCGGMQSN